MPKFQPQSFDRVVSKTVQSNYLLYLPVGYEINGNERFPLMLFLHGAGERGDNLDQVKVHGPFKEIENGRELPFVCVAPQCPEGEVWDAETLAALLDDVEAHNRIDPDRIYVTGLSMGGYGTWALAAHQPNRFAAIVPICGGGSPLTATKISHLPIWVRHGDHDEAVPVAQSQVMVDRLLGSCAKNVRFDVIEGGGHDVWTDFYADDALYDWLLLQKRQS